MSEPLDLDGIEARANAATPGPWEADSHSVGAGEYWVAHIPGYDPGEGSGNPEASADAEHIAGMDPATTLSMVAEVRALRAALGDVVGALGPDRICGCPPSDGDCGLREEAADALATARAALDAERPLARTQRDREGSDD